MSERLPDFRFHHGGVSVPDLEAAIDWYREMLGFEVELRFPLPAIPAKVAMLKRGPMRIELFEPENGNPLPPDRAQPQVDVRTHGNKHMAFAVDDIHDFIRRLEEKGADFAQLIRDATGVRGCFIRDLVGNPIEFVQYRDGEPTRVEG